MLANCVCASMRQSRVESDLSSFEAETCIPGLAKTRHRLRGTADCLPVCKLSSLTSAMLAGTSNGFGGMNSDPFGFGQSSTAAPDKPMQNSRPMGGPAPMAPRGNAAVEQKKPKKDPFADLLG